MEKKEEKKNGKVNPEKEHQKDIETVVSKNDNIKPVPSKEDLEKKKHAK